MVSPELLQAEIVTLLRAHPSLASVDLHEAFWQGTPSASLKVRISLGRQEPYGNDSCQQTQSTGRWTVSVFSRADSSQEVSNYAGLVAQALIGKQFNTANFYSFTIKSRGILSPYRAPTEEWRADVYFEARLFAKQFAYVAV